MTMNDSARLTSSLRGCGGYCQFSQFFIEIGLVRRINIDLSVTMLANVEAISWEETGTTPSTAHQREVGCAQVCRDPLPVAAAPFTVDTADLFFHIGPKPCHAKVGFSTLSRLGAQDT
jgi:hypothetical protein